MSVHQVIARKYRPLSFDDVVGQDAIARTLKNAISTGRIAHAYMFCGPRGVGKTSTARILARALNCLERPAPDIDPCGTCDLCLRATQGEDLDVLEIDAASNRKVDDARSLIANVSFHPSRARFKVYIVDEVHMLTTEAFNALLKTLEEPPPHVKFIFATTDPQKVPATILSRCQRFDFRPVPPNDSAALLARICVSEGLVAEEAALMAVARASVGGLRDAQSLLEQLATLGNGAVRLEDLHALLGTVPAERMWRLFDTIRQSDVGATLHECGAILDAGTDPGELLRQAMHHARDLMLLRAAGPRSSEIGGDAATRAALAEQAVALSDATLVYAITVLTEALKSVRLLGEGRLLAEAAFARLAGQGEMRFLDGLVRDLNRLEGRLEGHAEVSGSAERVGSAGRGEAGGRPPRSQPSVAHSGGSAAPPASGSPPAGRSGGGPSAQRGPTSGSGAPRASGASQPRDSGIGNRPVRGPGTGTGTGTGPVMGSSDRSSPPFAPSGSPPRAAADSHQASELRGGDSGRDGGSFADSSRSASTGVATTLEPPPASAPRPASTPERSDAQRAPRMEAEPSRAPEFEEGLGASGSTGWDEAVPVHRSTPSDAFPKRPVPNDRTAGPSGGPSGSARGPAPAPAPASEAASAELSGSGMLGAPSAADSVPAPSPESPAAAVDDTGLRARWSEVLEGSRGSSMLRTALVVARVQEEGPKHVTLSVPRGFPVLNNALADPESARSIRSLLAGVAGRRLEIRVVEREPDPEPERAEGARRTAAEMLQQRLSSADVDAIRQAPISKLIETELAGRIVHMERDA